MSTDNSLVELFNGTFRAECLDTHWFPYLNEAKPLIELLEDSGNAKFLKTALYFSGPE